MVQLNHSVGSCRWSDDGEEGLHTCKTSLFLRRRSRRRLGSAWQHVACRLVFHFVFIYVFSFPICFSFFKLEHLQDTESEHHTLEEKSRAQLRTHGTHDMEHEFPVVLAFPPQPPIVSGCSSRTVKVRRDPVSKQVPPPKENGTTTSNRNPLFLSSPHPASNR